MDAPTRGKTIPTGIMIAGFPAAVAGKVLHLRRELEDAGGSLMVLRQPSGGKLPCWGAPPDSLSLMRSIKQRFDQKRVLNPGRFLGGI